MAKRQVVFPNISNWTPAAFVDELGRMSEARNDGQKIEGYLKEALKARLPEGQRTTTGDHFTCNIERITQTRLDGEAVKELLEVIQKILDEDGDKLPMHIRVTLEGRLTGMFKTIEFDQMKFARVQKADDTK